MASRLTVVVSQSLSRDAASADLEETLVAELMMTTGLDATMVGPLERIQTDDTDFLCVSSFQHSFVIASWLSPEDLQSHWQRLGLDGSVVPLTLDGSTSSSGDGRIAPSTGSKRIYHVRLQSDSKIASILPRLQQLLADRQVKTVEIDLLSSNVSGMRAKAGEPVKASAPQPVAEPSRSEGQESSPERLQSKEGDVSHATEGVDARSRTHHDAASGVASSSSQQPSENEDEFQHLDQLVDDLDELDL